MSRNWLKLQPPNALRDLLAFLSTTKKARDACKHVNWTWVDANGRITHDNPNWPPHFATLCVECGYLLPLGAANDKPEAVQLEIHAVELLARYETNGLTEYWENWTLPAIHGWRDYINHAKGGDCSCAEYVPNSWHAGYLARCIHEAT